MGKGYWKSMSIVIILPPAIFSIKGALDKYNIYLLSNCIEDFKLNQCWNFQLILPMHFHFRWGILWTASSSECPVGYCYFILYSTVLCIYWSRLWKIENDRNTSLNEFIRTGSRISWVKLCFPSPIISTHVKRIREFLSRPLYTTEIFIFLQK